MGQAPSFSHKIKNLAYLEGLGAKHDGMSGFPGILPSCILFQSHVLWPEFKYMKNIEIDRKRAVRGSVIFALFAAVGMIGVIGAGTMSVLKGPVQTASLVTKRTLAENNMMVAGKLAIMKSREVGDCDNDGTIEPVGWADPAGKPVPVNGGLIPVTIGATQQDPWGNIYGYCSWDHGTSSLFMTCGTTPRRLSGSTNKDNIVIAVISAGPDKVFQTICNNEGAGSYVSKISGSDDLMLGYTYAEAEIMAGGLWNLVEDDVTTAEIDKNLSVKDETGTEQLSFDTTTKELVVADGGTGSFPTMKTDFVQNYEGESVEFLSSIKVSAGEAIDMNNNKIVNVALPVEETDGVPKKYVDEALGIGKTKCESFTANLCLGGSATAMDKTSLGACKKACENAGSQCCVAVFPLLGNNPNAELASCNGYSAPSQPVGSRNLTILLGSLSAYCYKNF
jgi:hypothetical protein